jgi:hypothetical protein
MRDQVTGIWLSTYASAIRADAIAVSERLQTQSTDLWEREFSLTEGAALARLLYKTVAGITLY